MDAELAVIREAAIDLVLGGAVQRDVRESRRVREYIERGGDWLRSVGERVRSGSVDSPGVDDGYLVPANPQIIELFSNSSGIENGLMVPTRE